MDGWIDRGWMAGKETGLWTYLSLYGMSGGKKVASSFFLPSFDSLDEQKTAKERQAYEGFKRGCWLARIRRIFFRGVILKKG